MHLVVDADKRSSLLNLKELLHYKDLFYILAYRDLRVRYAQTFLINFVTFIFTTFLNSVQKSITLYYVDKRSNAILLVRFIVYRLTHHTEGKVFDIHIESRLFNTFSEVTNKQST